MTIIGINFTKMLVERKSGAKGKINISNNVSIKSVEEVSLNFGNDKQKSLKFIFAFASKYDPEVGIINLDGEVIYLLEKSKAEEIVKSWEKDKKIENDLMTVLLNNILNKCNIEALLLSKEMGLPAPIPLPKVNPQQGKPEATKEKVKK